MGASLGATLFAGCSGETAPSGAAGGSPTAADDDSTTATGTFRLLISDQPAAIGDFDALNVSFDRARIFRGEGTDDDAGEATDTASPTAIETETAPATETETATVTGTTAATEEATETETEAEDDEPEDGGQRGFFVIDLAGATVDLTQVVGDRAIGVFDGTVPEGRYTKIELYAASVEGLVDGKPVNVMIPSGKLQLVTPFEVVAGETLSFVFDINVVEKGQTGAYNLLPVISESGVAGRDVEVNAGGDGRDGAEPDDGETEETEESEGEDGRGDGGDHGEGPPNGSDS